MNSDYLSKGCAEVIRELAKLVDSGVFLDRMQFHQMCENDRFVEELSKKYGESVHFDYLNPDSPIGDQDVIAYFNDGMARYSNATVMEDWGLKNNALLLGINIAFAISGEQT